MNWLADEGGDPVTVRLDPGSYVCAEHSVNLTSQVVVQLEEQGTPAAMAPRAGKRPFAVAVTCRGTDSKSEHALICRGEFSVTR